VGTRSLGPVGRPQEQGVAVGVLGAIELSGDVTGDGISMLVFTILSAAAEAERDGRCERIYEVKRDQKAGKRYLGRVVPFG
jgi:putative DNA-invertase from lambdoid prophage Rac